MCKNVKQNVLFERSEFTFCSFCMCKSRPETKSEDEAPKQNRCSMVRRCDFEPRTHEPCVPTLYHRPFRCFAPQRPAYNKVKPLRGFLLLLRSPRTKIIQARLHDFYSLRSSVRLVTRHNPNWALRQAQGPFGFCSRYSKNSSLLTPNYFSFLNSQLSTI